VAKPEVGRFLAGIEKSVVHYGSSTGFFGRKMFERSPGYLSAAVLYESSVIESYDPQYRLPFPVVAIYPKEGTFWSDHTVGVVDREWVSPEHREAAQAYIRFLLEPGQQARAIPHGFRPASVDVPLGPPIDAAHGVDPKEPQTTLEVPSPLAIESTLQLWREAKRTANVTLALDVSGSMNEEGGAKIAGARDGARQLVAALADRDRFALLLFNDNNLCDTAPDRDEYAARNAANIAWLQESFQVARRRGSAAIMIISQANPGWYPFEDDAPKRNPLTLEQVDTWASQPDGFMKFLLALRAEVIAFRNPVVYVHGDSHTFRIDKPFFDSKGQRLENFTRLETFGDNAANGTNDVNWVKVLVNPHSREVFSFQPQIVPANRVAHPTP
jgi:hypothetical protein